MTDIYELPSSRFSLLPPLFGDTWIDRALMEAVVEGAEPARVFADSPTDPTAALVCCPAGDYLIAGSPEPGPVREFIADLPVEAEVFGADAFAFFMPHARWGEALTADLRGAVPVLATRSFRYEKGAIEPVAHWQAGGTGAGAIVRRIDAGLLAEIDAGKIATSRAFSVHGQEGMEISRSDLAQINLGYCAIVDGVVASVASVMRVSTRHASLSIDTTAPLRGRGLATVACVALVEECLRRGRTPLWNTLASNRASAGTAVKLGLVEGPPQCESQWRGGWGPVTPTRGRWTRENSAVRTRGPVVWKRTPAQ